jgi:hypothetical protein
MILCVALATSDLGYGLAFNARLPIGMIAPPFLFPHELHFNVCVDRVQHPVFGSTACYERVVRAYVHNC